MVTTTNLSWNAESSVRIGATDQGSLGSHGGQIAVN